MNREEFTNRLKTIIKKIYSQGDFSYVKGDNDFYKEEEPVEDFYFFNEFPSLKKAIVSLMTDRYSNFITDIHWVAPKPTMFKVVLHNDQNFYITYSRKSWIAQIEGKKYYLNSINEEEQATESISRLLRYPSSGLTKATPTEEPAPEEPATEEPATEEPTPEAPVDTTA